MLIEKGADPAATDRKAVTPMIGAAYSWFYDESQWKGLQVDILRILLEAEPQRFDREDSEDRSAKKWASEKGLSEHWQEWQPV